MAIEIVDLPINSMVIFHSYVNVYQRVSKLKIYPAQICTNINIIWVNENISLTWIKASYGDDFPYEPWFQDSGEQWGRYNLPRYMSSTNHTSGYRSNRGTLVGEHSKHKWFVYICVHYVVMFRYSIFWGVWYWHVLTQGPNNQSQWCLQNLSWMMANLLYIHTYPQF